MLYLLGPLIGDAEWNVNTRERPRNAGQVLHLIIEKNVWLQLQKDFALVQTAKEEGVIYLNPPVGQAVYRSFVCWRTPRCYKRNV